MNNQTQPHQLHDANMRLKAVEDVLIATAQGLAAGKGQRSTAFDGALRQSEREMLNANPPNRSEDMDIYKDARDRLEMEMERAIRSIND